MNDPVLTANVIDVAAEAVVANDAEVVVLANDDVTAKEAVGGIKVMEVAAEAVVAKDAVSGTKVIEVAADAVVVNEDVSA